MREGDRPSPQAMNDAAAWMARLRADDRTDADVRAFQAWFAADILHFRAFEHISEVWDAVGGTSVLRKKPETGAGSIRRREAIAAIGALVVVGGTAGFWKAGQARTYKTDVGEQKHVVLGDGTRLFLDTDTCCTVAPGEGRQTVQLKYGRANFRTSSNLPFSVEVGENIIRALTAQFDVRKDLNSDMLSVVLIQGQASFAGSGDASKGDRSRKIAAGEQLIADQAAITVSRADLRQLLSWQRGQAVFENSKLENAIYEMNRYSSNKLSVADPGISDLRISGVYAVGDNAAFANAAAHLLPIHAILDNASGKIQLFGDKNRT